MPVRPLPALQWMATTFFWVGLEPLVDVEHHVVHDLECAGVV
eukprot:CAMPEP_0119469342 /NCGR_PEP_ID=MMETSP1344-20130328/2710_1 /TAXON_ID=236787 /ORGANISM="Florenciella parvula, Strain CCMP2471" /LENGTH=41 /DNA_ID= /DNA_START= /DNA_END= /DNA_ORIENTATION=